jgi:hypothetical protein
MSWELGGTPGVVDARDALGRPMPTPLPMLFIHEVEQRLDLAPWPAPEPLQIVFETPHPGMPIWWWSVLGFILGVIATAPWVGR